MLVEHAALDGEVQTKRTDGTGVILEPVDKLHSPLDVNGIDLPISTQEIIELVREGRKRTSHTVNSQCSEIA